MSYLFIPAVLIITCLIIFKKYIFDVPKDKLITKTGHRLIEINLNTFLYKEKFERDDFSILQAVLPHLLNPEAEHYYYKVYPEYGISYSDIKSRNILNPYRRVFGDIHSKLWDSVGYGSISLDERKELITAYENLINAYHNLIPEQSKIK